MLISNRNEQWFEKEIQRAKLRGDGMFGDLSIKHRFPLNVDHPWLHVDNSSLVCDVCAKVIIQKGLGEFAFWKIHRHYISQSHIEKLEVKHDEAKQKFVNTYKKNAVSTEEDSDTNNQEDSETKEHEPLDIGSINLDATSLDLLKEFRAFFDLNDLSAVGKLLENLGEDLSPTVPLKCVVNDEWLKHNSWIEKYISLIYSFDDIWGHIQDRGVGNKLASQRVRARLYSSNDVLPLGKCSPTFISIAQDLFDYTLTQDLYFELDKAHEFSLMIDGSGVKLSVRVIFWSDSGGGGYKFPAWHDLESFKFLKPGFRESFQYFRTY